MSSLQPSTINERDIGELIAILAKEPEIECEFHRPPVASDITPCSHRVLWRVVYVCGCVEISCQSGYDYEHENCDPDYTVSCLGCGQRYDEVDWVQKSTWRPI